MNKLITLPLLRNTVETRVPMFVLSFLAPEVEKAELQKAINELNTKIFIIKDFCKDSEPASSTATILYRRIKDIISLGEDTIVLDFQGTRGISLEFICDLTTLIRRNHGDIAFKQICFQRLSKANLNLFRIIKRKAKAYYKNIPNKKFIEYFLDDLDDSELEEIYYAQSFHDTPYDLGEWLGSSKQVERVCEYLEGIRE